MRRRAANRRDRPSPFSTQRAPSRAVHPINAEPYIPNRRCSVPEPAVTSAPADFPAPLYRPEARLHPYSVRCEHLRSQHSSPKLSLCHTQRHEKSSARVRALYRMWKERRPKKSREEPEATIESCVLGPAVSTATVVATATKARATKTTTTALSEVATPVRDGLRSARRTMAPPRLAARGARLATQGRDLGGGGRGRGFDGLSVN